MTKKAAPPLDARSARLVGVRKLVAQLGGARLCYGEPVRVGEREVIPVARVRSAGGVGFGSGVEDVGGGGGGGGGVIGAPPIGVLDGGPPGGRFGGVPGPAGRGPG